MNKFILLILIIFSFILIGCEAKVKVDGDKVEGEIKSNIDEAIVSSFNEQIEKFGTENVDYSKIKELIGKVNEINQDDESPTKVDIFYDESGENDFLSSAKKYSIEYIKDKVNNIINEIRIYE